MGHNAMLRDREALPMIIAPGQTIGGYQVADPLGAGTFGQVFRAVHMASGEPRALKVLHDSPAVDRDAREQFLRAARRLMDLRDEHLVRVFDVFEQDGADY